MYGSNCKNSIDDQLCAYDVYTHYMMNFLNQYASKVKQPFVLNFYFELSGLPHFESYASEVLDNQYTHCPHSHFECRGICHCLPVYVRCNGVYDCPGRQDEASCDSYTCPGFYRCRGSKVCLHPDHVCDGWNHCPQQDDEWFCAPSCPAACTCQGLSFTCRRGFPVDAYPDVRYLDASGSGLSPARLHGNAMLVYLGLRRCGLARLDLPALPNLNIMDLSHNHIPAVTLEHLGRVSNLRLLSLTGNPLTSLFTSQDTPDSVKTFPKLRIIDLSLVRIPYLDTGIFTPFSGLTTLNLSDSATEEVSGGWFQHPACWTCGVVT